MDGIATGTNNSSAPAPATSPVTPSPGRGGLTFGVSHSEDSSPNSVFNRSETVKTDGRETGNAEATKPDGNEWWSKYKKEDIETWEKSHKSYTQNAQRLAEERKLYESNKKELERIQKEQHEKERAERMSKFNELTIDEQMAALYENYGGIEKTVSELKEFQKHKATLERLSVKMLVDDIKQQVKKVDKTDITDEQIEQVAKFAHEKFGVAISNPEQFMFAWNATKNQFGSEIIKDVETKARLDAHKEIAEKRERLAPLGASGMDVSLPSGNSKPKTSTLKDRRTAMLRDPDLMKK